MSRKFVAMTEAALADLLAADLSELDLVAIMIDGVRMRAAYHADSALAAQAMLEALAKELDKTHPGAAGSLREGLAEILTVLRLDVPPPSPGRCAQPTRSSR